MEVIAGRDWVKVQNGSAGLEMLDEYIPNGAGDRST